MAGTGFSYGTLSPKISSQHIILDSLEDNQNSYEWIPETNFLSILL